MTYSWMQGNTSIVVTLYKDGAGANVRMQRPQIERQPAINNWWETDRKYAEDMIARARRAGRIIKES